MPAIEIVEDRLTKDFVAPNLSLLLMQLGVTPNVNYRWKVKEACISLISHAFDDDNYYSSFEKLLLEMNGCTIIPAYSTKDLEQLFGEYACYKNSNQQYSLCVCKSFGIDEVKSNRLPDCFAQLLITIVQKRIWSLDHINKTIERT